MANDKSTYWERLDLVITISGMSIQNFAKHIGLNAGDKLYQIKRGKHSISLKLAYKIEKCFPEFSAAWLLTGDPRCAPNHLDELYLFYHTKNVNFIKSKFSKFWR